jgi:hypothetical protein
MRAMAGPPLRAGAWTSRRRVARAAGRERARRRRVGRRGSPGSVPVAPGRRACCLVVRATALPCGRTRAGRTGAAARWTSEFVGILVFGVLAVAAVAYANHRKHVRKRESLQRLLDRDQDLRLTETPCGLDVATLPSFVGIPRATVGAASATASRARRRCSQAAERPACPARPSSGGGRSARPPRPSRAPGPPTRSAGRPSRSSGCPPRSPTGSCCAPSPSSAASGSPAAGTRSSRRSSTAGSASSARTGP